MFFKRIIFILLWNVLGFVFINSFYFYQHRNSHQELFDQVDEITLHSESNHKFMIKLQNIFLMNKDVKIISIANDKQQFEGSIYDSDRISKEEYKNFMNIYKKNLNRAPEYMQSFLGSNSNFIKYKNVLGKEIIFWGVKKASIKDTIDFFFQKGWKNQFLFISFYILSGVLISLFAFRNRKKKNACTQDELIKLKENDKSPQEETLKSNQYESENITDQLDMKNILLFFEEKEDIYSRKYSMFENQIKFFMNKIYHQFNFSKIGFFLWMDEKWQPYILKQGKIFISYSNTAIQIPLILEGLTTKDSSMLVSTDLSEIAVSVKSQKEMVGAFYIEPRKNDKIPESTQIKLQKEIGNVAKSLVLQISFERASIDNETYFYTSPYFQMILDEKIRSGREFASLALEISNIHEISPKTLQIWSRSVVTNMRKFIEENFISPEAENIHYLITRIANDKFIITFDMDQIQLFHLRTFLDDLIEFSKYSENLPIDVHGCIIPPSDLIKNAHIYLQQIDHYLRYSEGRQELKRGKWTLSSTKK